MLAKHTYTHAQFGVPDKIEYFIAIFQNESPYVLSLTTIVDIH